MRFERLIKNTYKHLNSSVNKSNYPLSLIEHDRISKISRYVPGQTKLFGKKFSFVDSVTFLSSIDEIFKKDIYKFSTTNPKPIIVDCGANIGLATIYFKRNFPDAEIIAFEPDPNIFEALKENVINQGFKDVDLKNEAVSNKDGMVYFFMEGGHSGMIVHDKLNERVIPVKSIRLKSILQHFDELTFLKIDIEGHERYLITDIADELKKVTFLFLEYHSFVNRNQNLDEILNILSSAGLRYYIKESCNKPLPFINRELFLEMDLLLNIFCYRY
jgi:FkbM family methyltransferase